MTYLSAAGLRHLATAALDLLLPPQCAACDAPVAAPGELCAACFSSLTFITEPLCRRCGLAFESAGQAGSDAACPACTQHPPPWRQARAALHYDPRSRQLILPLKHADRPEMADALALHMHRAGAFLLAQADLLVPVPLHRWRLVARRYNQAALLAHALTRLSGIPTLPDALARTRPTPRLGALSAAARSVQLDGAIAVRPHRAKNISRRRVLLVDDVLTSGATAAACARALLAAGATHVDVLVAARVADPRAA